MASGPVQDFPGLCQCPGFGEEQKMSRHFFPVEKVMDVLFYCKTLAPLYIKRLHSYGLFMFFHVSGMVTQSILLLLVFQPETSGIFLL